MDSQLGLYCCLLTRSGRPDSALLHVLLTGSTASMWLRGEEEQLEVCSKMTAGDVSVHCPTVLLLSLALLLHLSFTLQLDPRNLT